MRWVSIISLLYIKKTCIYCCKYDDISPTNLPLPAKMADINGLWIWPDVSEHHISCSYIVTVKLENIGGEEILAEKWFQRI